jgi:hypothetical protein
MSVVGIFPLLHFGYPGISLSKKDNEREGRDRKGVACASYQNNLLEVLAITIFDGFADVGLRNHLRLSPKPCNSNGTNELLSHIQRQ